MNKAIAAAHNMSTNITIPNSSACDLKNEKNLNRACMLGHSNFEKKSNTLRTFVIRVAEDDKKLTYYWQTLSFSIVGKR